MNNPWEHIKTPKSDLSARRIDHKHPLDIYWAKDRAGKYLFVCKLTDKCKLPPKFPALLGIEVTSIPDNKQLVLTLKKSSDWELFFSLCNDIISATRALEPSAIVSVIFRRIERWREFLKQDREKILSERKIKGLIGELIYIQDFVSPKFGIAKAIEFWTGPEGSTQDFSINNTAIEVKCQDGTSSPKVRISSPEQLSGQLGRLYLFVVTLGRTEPEASNAITLPSLISEIQQELENAGHMQQLERLQDILLEMGYSYSDEYLSYCYIVSSKKFYEVKDDFPRLDLSDIPNGLSNITFDLELIACEPFLTDESWMEDI